jgi:Mlc titration factor MtfA (ptsG expression regulator)
MTLTVYLVSAVLVGIAAFLYPGLRKRFILSRSFPDAWMKIVRLRLPFFDKLEIAEQEQLQNLIKLFIAGKKFHGCDGLKITDDIRVTIAAEACLLLLNRKTRVFPGLKHVLVYPAAFRAAHVEGNSDGTLSENSRGLLGESWQSGKVILSWEDVTSGAADFSDGRNVALHEFSHQLDSESGTANGAPLLRSSRYPRWAKVLSDEFRDLQQALQSHETSVMDFYGATNPAEFFAVATETFFEKPVQMKESHPELFEQLQQYYRVNPETWH